MSYCNLMRGHYSRQSGTGCAAARKSCADQAAAEFIRETRRELGEQWWSQTERIAEEAQKRMETACSR